MKAQAFRWLWPGRLLLSGALFFAVLLGAGCHTTPVVVKMSSVAVGGTLAGVVTGPPDAVLSDRTITLVNTQTGQRFETRTGPNGGYAIRVPAGAYRLEVQLRAGEQLAAADNLIVLNNEPGEVDVNLDATAASQRSTPP